MKCDELTAYKGDVYIPVYGSIADAQVYLKSEADKVIASHKYRRCLAMAKIASHNWHLHNSFYLMGHKDFELKKCERYERHRVRWLELAEKFKEAK